MSIYSRVCIASSAVSVGTVGLLLWSASGDSDSSYIYVSLAAPTIALSHHLLYFFSPFGPSSPPMYTFVSPSSEENTTPTTNHRISRLCRGYVKRWKSAMRLVSEEGNAMASSTPSAILLILIAVFTAALGLSSGAVALLNTIDVSPTPAQLDAARSDSLPSHTDDTRQGSLDLTAPPTFVLAIQAACSLVQAGLLVSLALLGMRLRSLRLEEEQDPELLDVEWVYHDDENEDDK